MATRLRIKKAAQSAGFKSPTDIRDKILKAKIISDENVALTISHRLWADKEVKMVGISTIDLACWLFECSPGDLFDYKRTKPTWKTR